MKKLIFAALVLSMCMSFAACGSVDESSAPAAESSQTTSEAQLENVTIKMDSSKLLSGVEFTDSELLDKITEFRTKVMENRRKRAGFKGVRCWRRLAGYKNVQKVQLSTMKQERVTMSVSAQRPITQATILPRNLRNMS